MSPIADQLTGTGLSELGRRPATKHRTEVSHSGLVDHAQVDKALAGHKHLDRTGFAHMGGRLHDPRIGRFLIPDPVVSGPSSVKKRRRSSLTILAMPSRNLEVNHGGKCSLGTME